MKLVNEEDLGIEKMVDEIEEAFLRSCAHNNTRPDDLDYFRRYVWNCLALHSAMIDKILNNSRLN